MNNKMLALYGLKWNPFTPNVPTEALHVTTRLQSFCWRVQQLAGDGGFALVTGAPGCGKSAALRILTASLATQRDVTVGVISRPQANIADFYREMGELFGVELRPHNRYGGAKILRQRWQAHIQSTLTRPVLLVDEAQEMQPAVLAELRLLTSADLDSQILLTIVLAGDGRLAERLRTDECLPLASRMRVFAYFSRFAKDMPSVKRGNFWGLPINFIAFSIVVVITTSATLPVFGEYIHDPVEIVARVDSVVAAVLGETIFIVATIGINIGGELRLPGIRLLRNCGPKHHHSSLPRRHGPRRGRLGVRDALAPVQGLASGRHSLHARHVGCRDRAALR